MNYNILGEPFPVVIFNLEPNESIICQKGGMAWMSPNMQMATKTGGLGKMFGRAISGESLFQNTYTANGGPGTISVNTSGPGSVLHVPITPNKGIIAQKQAFLAMTQGINMSVYLQKKLGSGFFGGEGFIMQKFEGNGDLFIEIDGSVVEYDLQAGESMILDTGYLAAMDVTCSMTIDTVKGVGNMLFGGEGLFNTRVTGPGHIWVQTMPMAQFAQSIIPYIPQKNN